MVGGNGIAGVLTAVALSGGGSGMFGEAPVREVVSPTGSLEPWEEVTSTECDFRAADAPPVESDLCAPFAIARFAGAASTRTTDKALACAAKFDTDCILSTEVGLGIPAAFVYHQEKGVRMLVAPRLIPLSSEAALNATTERVRVHNPAESRDSRVLSLNDTIVAEFLVGGERSLTTETLRGPDAFCVQLLRLAYSKECWLALE